MKEKTKPLLGILLKEKEKHENNSIYNFVLTQFTYHSNKIEGNKLSFDQVRTLAKYYLESNNQDSRNDDVVETLNHFECIDQILDHLEEPLNEDFIKELHLTLKNNTSDSRIENFEIGNYKKLPNEIGGITTTPPEKVEIEIRNLIKSYNKKENKTFEDLLDFHVKFERIHPFQDGNGRIGRLLLFKECLRNNIVPFIIDDNLKMFYYRGLANWNKERGYLVDTCLTAQDQFKIYLDNFQIPYEN